MNCNINIEKNKSKIRSYGYIKGTVDTFNFFAIVNKHPDKKGLNAKTKMPGLGLITRLCIHKDIPMSGFTKRLIYADFKNGEWEVLNDSYQETTYELIEYIERIYFISLIKEAV